MWGNWGLCGNFATNLNYSYGGGNVGIWIYDAPTLRKNERTSGKARGDWEQVVFSEFSLDCREDSKKIAGENEKVRV